MLRVKYTIRFTPFSRPNADGSRLVIMSVTWKGQRVRLYLPVSVFPDQWDETAQLAMPTKQHREVSAINGTIIEYRGRVSSYFEKSFLSDYLPAEQVEEQLRFAYLICKYCDYITPDNIARKARGKYANFREYGWENFDSGYTFELSRFGFYDREAGCEKPLSKESFTKFGSQLPLAIDAFLSGEEA